MTTFDPKKALIAGTVAGLAALIILVLLDRLSVRAMFRELRSYLDHQDEFRVWLGEHDQADGQ